MIAEAKLCVGSIHLLPLDALSNSIGGSFLCIYTVRLKCTGKCDSAE